MTLRDFAKSKTKQIIFFLLLTTVLIFILMNIKEKDHLTGTFSAVFPQLWSQTADAQTNNFKTTFTKPEVQRCSYTDLSSENTKEGRKLLDSITWPETLPLPEPFSLTRTTSAAKSSFSIERRSGGWRVGDELTVRIQLRDFNGNPKKGGGDMISSRLYNQQLGAGVAGRVHDHLDGTFTAVFPLLWNGTAGVQVTLHHASESITVLKRLTKEQPQRVYFVSEFMLGNVTERSICNVCPDPNTTALCNFTDLNTGERWFCFEPKTLDCSTRISHAMGGNNYKFSNTEQTLFQRGINMQVSISSSEKFTVTILPKADDTKKTTTEPSGYYYMNQWRPRGGSKVYPFNNDPNITVCLRGKHLHMFGDSTVRQFYELITARQPNLLKFDKHTCPQCGPFLAIDPVNDIMLTHRCHGPPIRAKTIPVSQLRYVANELDRLAGGPNTVVVVGVWAHFGSFPMEVYYQRLMAIHRALERLLRRAPGTKIIIRSGNMVDLTLGSSMVVSDWYTLQRDKLLRAVFKDMDVLLLDVWDMVQASHHAHNLHPPLPIIKQIVDVILSYTCPEKLH